MTPVIVLASNVSHCAVCETARRVRLQVVPKDMPDTDIDCPHCAWGVPVVLLPHRQDRKKAS